MTSVSIIFFIINSYYIYLSNYKKIVIILLFCFISQVNQEDNFGANTQDVSHELEVESLSIENKEKELIIKALKKNCQIKGMKIKEEDVPKT